MQIGGWKKAVLGILATLLLGALGSGLWDVALKPGGYWFWHAVLTAVTFGSRYLRDQVYLEAAKGNHEAFARHSSRVLGLFLGFLSGVITSLMVFVLRRLKPDKERETTKPESSQRHPKLLRYPAAFILLFMVYLLAAFLVEDLKVGTANEAYTYFRQSMNICRPYISEHEAQLLESRFAALRTREEYIGITDEMKQIAGSNHLNLPDFKPW